jgi:pimeloyl-ACP methyl ester carboxylesterase
MLRVALALAVLVGTVAAGAAASPRATDACITTNDRFRTADGVRLEGAVLGRGKTGVVFAHQLAGDRCQWLPFARELTAKGYRALVFDMRGYGSSSGLGGTWKLRAPALFVAGRDDGSYALATRTLYRAAASKDKKLLMAPTPWHGVDLVSRPDVKKAVVAFIGRVG